MAESLEDFKKRTQAEVDAGTYVPPTRKAFGSDVANLALGIGRKAAEGMFWVPGRGLVSETPVATPSVAAGTPTPASPVQPAAVSPVVAKVHPLDKYPNVYEALRALPDDKFKKFIDEHGGIDRPLVPGTGYVSTKKVNPEDGKEYEVMQRIIENPADRPREPMTLHEAEVAAKVIGGVGAREEAREARKDRNLILQEGIEARKTAAEEARILKREQGFENELKTFGKKTVNMETGGSDIDYSAHLLKTAISAPDRIPDKWKPEAASLIKGYDDYVALVFKSNPKLKDTPETRKLLLDKYFNPPVPKK